MLTLAALYLVLIAAPQACPASFAVTAHALGPLTLGEPVSALKARFNMSEGPFASGGIAGAVYTVAICSDAAIDAITEGKHASVRQLRTASPIFLTAKGAHVGMSLADLKRLYPAGKLNVFIHDGAVANFDTGTGVIFDFDGSMVPHGCYDTDGDCKADPQTFKSIDVYIRAR
ncbi:MAG TPA: hypothetical protein VG839_08575 [Asticcacaulis sp.]|nr:hypothetical protein [Asticcacaulis sp.]